MTYYVDYVAGQIATGYRCSHCAYDTNNQHIHGEWVDGGVDGVGACDIEYRYNKCSVCGYKYSFPIKYNFCPNCGADMRMEGGA